jgi:outer membrane lipopolysaccharide assembly protein LptE/RlpB
VQIVAPILGFLAALAAALLLASCLWQRRKPRSIPLEEQSVLRTPPPPL